MLEEFYESIIYFENYFKLGLGILILINFVFIFILRFQIKIDTKLKEFFSLNSLKTKEELKKIKSVLLIIAHPDDEIMFWSPTIKKLQSLKIKIKILCLSNGNYYNLGNKRIEEFKEVSKNLKLEDNEILDIKELQDDLNKKWDEKIVAFHIENYIKKYNKDITNKDISNNEIDNNEIDTIITFDEFGITKHPNHISVYNGLVYYLKENRELIKQKNIKVYLLDSFNPLFQYTFLIPFWSFYFKEYGFFNFNMRYGYNLMKLYKTQFNFNRKLHVIFSSYTYCNSFTKVELK